LEEIVDEGQAWVAFPLSKSTVYADAEAGISIAPPNSALSNVWTYGAVHRDFNDGAVHRDFNDDDQSRVYVFLL
jgi:hypothetical protein